MLTLSINIYWNCIILSIFYVLNMCLVCNNFLKLFESIWSICSEGRFVESVFSIILCVSLLLDLADYSRHNKNNFIDRTVYWVNISKLSAVFPFKIVLVIPSERKERFWQECTNAVDRNKLVPLLWKTVWNFLKNLIVEILFCPLILLLSISKGNEMSGGYLCSPVLWSIIYSSSHLDSA